MNGVEHLKQRRKSCESNDEEYVVEYLDEAQEERSINGPKTDQIETQKFQFLNENVNLFNVHLKENFIPCKQKVKRSGDIKQRPTKKSLLLTTLNSPNNLKNERILSEIEYLKSKTQFYAKKQHKLHRQRTLMLLEIKKICLEIENLEEEEKC